MICMQILYTRGRQTFSLADYQICAEVWSRRKWKYYLDTFHHCFGWNDESKRWNYPNSQVKKSITDLLPASILTLRTCSCVLTDFLCNEDCYWRFSWAHFQFDHLNSGLENLNKPLAFLQPVWLTAPFL